MKKLLLMFAVGALVLGTSSCKKGENDPFLSLKTRDARITGKWVLQESNSTSVNVFTSGGVATTTTSTTTYDGTFQTTVSGGNAWTVAHTSEMTINKDGTYSTVSNTDGFVTESTGYWWWLSDNKKKTRIALDDDWNSFEIDQLKNKEMIIKQDSWSKDTDVFGDSDENTDTYTATFKKS